MKLKILGITVFEYTSNSNQELTNIANRLNATRPPVKKVVQPELIKRRQKSIDDLFKDTAVDLPKSRNGKIDVDASCKLYAVDPMGGIWQKSFQTGSAGHALLIALGNGGYNWKNRPRNNLCDLPVDNIPLVDGEYDYTQGMKFVGMDPEKPELLWTNRYHKGTVGFELKRLACTNGFRPYKKEDKRAIKLVKTER